MDLNTEQALLIVENSFYTSNQPIPRLLGHTLLALTIQQPSYL